MTGYQIVITSSKNFNEVPFNWWNHIAPLPKTGSLCTPQNFTAGSTFFTDYATFQWEVVSPNFNDLSVQFISYKGTNLNSCDAAMLTVDANIISSTVSLSSYVLCLDEEFPVLIRTLWNPWGGASDTETQVVKQEFSSSTTNTLVESAAASIL